MGEIKVGERVRVLSGALAGQEGEVLKFDEPAAWTGVLAEVKIDGLNQVVDLRADQLEAVLPETGIKIGDRVQVRVSHGGLFNGRTGVVRGIRESQRGRPERDAVRVELDGGGGNWALRKDLRLLGDDTGNDSTEEVTPTAALLHRAQAETSRQREKVAKILRREAEMLNEMAAGVEQGKAVGWALSGTLGRLGQTQFFLGQAAVLADLEEWIGESE